MIPASKIEIVIKAPPAMTFHENGSMAKAMLNEVAITADIGLMTAQVSALTRRMQIVRITQQPTVQTKDKKRSTRRWFHDHENVSPFSKGKA